MKSNLLAVAFLAGLAWLIILLAAAMFVCLGHLLAPLLGGLGG